MTIEKAIETLEYLYTTECCKEESDYDEAVRLGIEALRRVREYRLPGLVVYRVLLPGETEK